MDDSAIVNPTDTTRLCSGCGCECAVTEFRLRTRNGRYRDHRCRVCHNATERRRRRSARQRDLRSTISRIQSARSFHRVAALAGGIVTRLGGHKATVALWCELLRSDNPRVALRAFNGVMRLREACEAFDIQRAELRERRRDRKRKLRKQQARRDQDRLDAMSDAELSAHIEELRIQHGYTVEEWKQLRAQYDREECAR